jgi:predicted NBD/HSP70 family sugar kinase
MECPHCCAENDQRRAADALEEIAHRSSRERESYTVSEPSKSKLVESQELAGHAEARFRMNDLRGAVQLITEAIELHPTFVSFYLQRARYFSSQGKKNEAVSDLRYSFEKENETLAEVERQLETDTLHELTSLRTELQKLIHEFKDNAKESAKHSKAQLEAEIETMRLKFSRKSLHSVVKDVEDNLQEVIQLIENNKYLDLLKVPALANTAKSQATKLIKLMDDTEKEAKVYLSKAEQQFQVVFSSRSQEFASTEMQEAQENLKQAKNAFATRELESYSKSIEFSKRAISLTDLVSRKIESQKQARELLSKAEQILHACLSQNISQFAPNEVSIAQNGLEEARLLFQSHKIENYSKSIESSKKVISELQKVEKIAKVAQENQAQTRRILRQTIWFIGVSVVIIIAVLAGQEYSMYSSYKDGIDAYTDLDYSSAIKKFEDIKHKKSLFEGDRYYKEITPMLYDSYHQIAKQYIQKGQWQSAKYEIDKLLFEAPNYLVSEDVSQEINYQQGIGEMKNRNWDTAMNFFQLVGKKYKSTTKFIEECKKEIPSVISDGEIKKLIIDYYYFESKKYYRMTRINELKVVYKSYYERLAHVEYEWERPGLYGVLGSGNDKKTFTLVFRKPRWEVTSSTH